MILKFGNVSVPYTVSWSREEDFAVRYCDHAGHVAICQSEARGEGKPAFGKPHMQRQRETIARGLCDLCGESLKRRTKVSLSHASMRANGAEGPAILQVEPLLHKSCALECLQHCPSLKRDISNGSLRVRQVSRHRVQFAVMSPQFVGVYVPGYRARPADRIVGHAKVELLVWKDRDEWWLGGGRQ